MKLIIVILNVVVLASLCSAQTCYTNYVNVTGAALINAGICPAGYVFKDKVCIEYTPKIGTSCDNNNPCLFSWLSCVSGVCQPFKSRLNGDKCTVKESCGSYDFNPLNCKSGSCSQYTTKNAAVGESCGHYDDSANTVTKCNSGLACLNGVCVSVKVLAENANCTASSLVEYCDNNLICLNSKCQKALTQGQSCGGTVPCRSGLVCRKKSSQADYTCENLADWNEYCESNSDCIVSAYGGLARCNKATNNCVRIYSILTYGACSVNEDCFSGFCSGGKCVSEDEVTKQTCSSNSCPTSTGACSCGGNPTSSRPGKCIPPCSGYITDLKTCIWNQRATNFVNLNNLQDSNQFSDLDSRVFTLCKTFFQNAYVCNRVYSSDAGIRDPKRALLVALIPGVDINAVLPPPNPILPIRYSPSPINSPIKSNISNTIVSSLVLIVAVIALVLF
ncbi:hypothetical protein ABK040_016504 [Willaertia magna]